MKKTFFLLAALMGSAISASAQKVFPDDLYSIPALFTNNHTAYMLTAQKERDENWNYKMTDICLFDMNLNRLQSFAPNEEVSCLGIDCIIDKNGLGYDVATDDVYLTQNFFNDDDDWEYIVPLKGEVTHDWGTEMETVGYTIKKTNGTVVGTLSFGNKLMWNTAVYVINDVIYTTLEEETDEDDYIYYFYTLPEFRKLIQGDANNVKAVPAMTRTVSKEAHDLAGRKAAKDHKGIVIQNGKKMLVK